MSQDTGGAWVSATYGLREREALLDLVEFTDMATRIVEHGHGAYQHEETLWLAAEAVTHRIGEAVGRLGEEFMTDHPSVPWRQIRGMRNLVAHDYGRVDHEIVWNTLVNDLPQLGTHVRGLLAR